MKLKEFINQLNEIVERNPKALELPVYSSFFADDDGETYFTEINNYAITGLLCGIRLYGKFYKKNRRFRFNSNIKKSNAIVIDYISKEFLEEINGKNIER